ncbi:MAG: hypothetical protein WC052_04435 [Patescibacteria group bacterium]
MISRLTSKHYNDIIDNAPERCKTYKVWWHLVSTCPSFLKRVPTEVATQSFYDDAVRKNCMVLCVVPRRNRTTELCMLAVASHRFRAESALSNVPCESQTENMILTAISVHGGYALEFAAFQTPAICIAAVKADPIAITWVIEQTPAICEMAIQVASEEGKDNLRDVVTAIRNQTLAICEMAIKTAEGYGIGERISIVTAIRNHSSEVCISVLRRLPQAFEYLRNHSREVCLGAIEIATDPVDVNVARILTDAREQTLEVCLAAYRKSLQSYRAIRDTGLCWQVMRLVLATDVLIPLRGADLSTALLTEVVDCLMDEKFPPMLWSYAQMMPPVQMWTLAAKVKHAV